MKGNPVVPGGPLTSKPTWWNTWRCSTTSVFFLLLREPVTIKRHEQGPKMIPATTKRLILNPTPLVSEAIEVRADKDISRYSAAAPEVLELRLQTLDREWNVERLTA